MELTFFRTMYDVLFYSTKLEFVNSQKTRRFFLSTSLKLTYQHFTFTIKVRNLRLEIGKKM